VDTRLVTVEPAWVPVGVVVFLIHTQLHVAHITQQATHSTCGVAMIDHKRLWSVRPEADQALAALVYVHVVALRCRDAVRATVVSIPNDRQVMVGRTGVATVLERVALTVIE
jgi:hypothetical protein